MGKDGLPFGQGNFSKVIRANELGDWQGISEEAYKKDSETHRGMARWELVGKRGESTQFHVRYFQIEPGGFSTFEKHVHEHAVFILRGRGKVRLGDRVFSVTPGDVVYICPEDPHQLSNPDGDEPLGFLCMVNADRDAPQPLSTAPTT